MQNQQVQQRMASLREDPEFKQMFQEIQAGGMGALMKYMNDPKVSSSWAGSHHGSLVAWSLA
jgi:hypothetical protein